MNLGQLDALVKQDVLTLTGVSWIKYNGVKIANGKQNALDMINANHEMETELLGKLKKPKAKTQGDKVSLEVTEKLGFRKEMRMVDTQVLVPHPDNPNVKTLISRMAPVEFEVLSSLIDLDEAKKLGNQIWKEKVKKVAVKGGGFKEISTENYTCIVNGRRFIIDKETHGSL